MIIVSTLVEPVVDDDRRVVHRPVADPVDLPKLAQLDVVVAAVLVDTALRPVLRQRRQPRVPLLHAVDQFASMAIHTLFSGDCIKLSRVRQAQLSPRDRAMRRVN